MNQSFMQPTSMPARSTSPGLRKPTTQHGYTYLWWPYHPLASDDTHHRVAEHRIVYYAAHGVGPFLCHWCLIRVTWDDLHIDHLDEVRKNNDLTNLVASCQKCNLARGKWHSQRTRHEMSGYMVEFEGNRQHISYWARRIGLSLDGMRKRLHAGWSIERALTEPSQRAPRPQGDGA